MSTPIEQYGAPASEFSEEFAVGMRKRMAVSYHKYGLVEHAVGKVEFVKSAIQRIEKYMETGNTEWLMDAGNYCMMEFMHPSHPEAHYRPTDSDESPGRIAKADNPNGQLQTSKANLDIRRVN